MTTPPYCIGHSSKLPHLPNLSLSDRKIWINYEKIGTFSFSKLKKYFVVSNQQKKHTICTDLMTHFLLVDSTVMKEHSLFHRERPHSSHVPRHRHVRVGQRLRPETSVRDGVLLELPVVVVVVVADLSPRVSLSETALRNAKRWKGRKAPKP